MGRKKLVRAAGLCGILGVAIVYPLILLARFYYPSFSWFNNALSDLGVGVSAPIFNTALLIGGALLLIFSLGLLNYTSGYIAKLGSLLLIAASIFLAAIGLFPENYGKLHFYVSVAFFVLIVFSLLTLGLSLILQSSRASGFLTVVGAIIAALIWIFPWTGVAIPETIASIILSARVVSFAYKMLVK
ncbi:MAG: DUF998 domain-containing protein [Nitrososphaerales archaeon]